MKTAKVADLRNEFASISMWIQNGDTVTITKRGRPFAKLVPVGDERKTPKRLDRMARLKRLFPEGPVAGNARDVVDYDRGDR